MKVRILLICTMVLNAAVARAQFAITTTSLPPGTIGVPYNATLSATGGTLPYNWSTPANLPPGLMFNSGSPNATITGTPVNGSSSSGGAGGAIIDPLPLQFRVMDAKGSVATATMGILIANPVVITTSSLPQATLGTGYHVCLGATGGVLAEGEFWSITGGGLPAGLSLATDQNCSGYGPAPSAAISGTPLQAGPFNVTLQVADSQGRTAQMAYMLTVGSSTGAGATLSANPPALSAGYTTGGPALAMQTLTISSSGPALAYNASVSYVPGASGNSNWISLTNASGISPSTIGVTFNAAGLAANVYKANIVIAAPGASNTVSVPVTLTVTSGITLILNPPTLNFTATQGGPSPSPQTVQFTTSSGSLNYGFSVDSGANWILVTPPGGVNPSSLAVSANPAGLTPGVYSGTIEITANGAVNSPQPLAVTLTVNPGMPTITSVLNGASLNGGPLAPGSIVTIKGTDLGPSTGISMQRDSNGDYGTTLGGTQVLINGVPAPLLYAQSAQVNAVVPFSIPAGSSVPVQVNYGGATSAAYTLQIQAASPALFTASMTGTGQGAILNQDSSVNSSANPAKAGTYVSLFGTGGGLLQIAEGDGTTAGVTNLVLPVTAQVNGVNAPVAYGGSAPGAIAGGMQVNVLIPANTPAGNIAIVVSVNGVASQSPVTVAVQ